MTDVVIVTEPEFAKAESFFDGQSALRVIAASEDERLLAKNVLAERCRAVIVGVRPYSGLLYEALGEIGSGADGAANGAIIARFGVGHDSIDKTLAREYGIIVTNTPGALDTSVAEHTLWLIGSLARHLPECHGAMLSHQWQPQAGVELRGQTLAILGFGAIGRRVAAMAGFGFGMRVIATGRTEVPELEEREGKSIEQLQREFGIDEYTADTDSVFARADVLSIHLPATQATQGFVNAKRLAMMKPSSRLVNTARGAVLDENALYDALAAGRLAGAALDVYQQEPYRSHSPGRDLRALTNIILTPHIGSNTIEANEAMARAALNNVASFLSGRRGELTCVGD